MIHLENISGEGSFMLLPGEYIETIIINNKLDKKIIGGVRFGKSHGANDVVGSLAVGELETTRIDLKFPPFSFTQLTEVFFDAVSDWNGAQIDIFVIKKSLING